ncbi:MAG TPA: hypothetical protein VNN22_13695 [Verrucomicrobiae bacterium]|nr:hypothetical protein [Verrucomicrobiae bacterium]
MSTDTNPDAASASSTRDNPCYGSDPNVASLNVFADDEHSYLLPYAQLLYAETIPNPALERNADAPPEKLVICFAAAEVILLGSGLQAVARKIQKCDLNFVKAADRRYAALLKTHVAAVTVKFTRQEI